MGDWLNPSKWTAVPFQDEMTGPVAITFLVVFALGFLATLILSRWPPRTIATHPRKVTYLRTYLGWLMMAFGFGLVCYVFQLMGLPFLGWRFWTWFSLLVLLAVLAFCAYKWKTEAEPQIAAYDAQQAKRHYQQQARRRPTGPGGAPVPRSARAEKRRQRAK